MYNKKELFLGQCLQNGVFLIYVKVKELYDVPTVLTVSQYTMRYCCVYLYLVHM